MADLSEAYETPTAALAKAEAKTAAPADPVAASKPSLARRILTWMKRSLFCCCGSKEAVEVAVNPLAMPVANPIKDVPQGMIMGFDGKLVKQYDPTSDAPCPHFLKTTSMSTGEESCLNCGTVTKESPRKTLQTSSDTMKIRSPPCKEA